MLPSLSLTGRVAVVIGGTSGIGRAIALGLAEAGADVVPTGRRQPLVETACADIRTHGRRTLVCCADVRARQAVEALRDRVLGELGRIDILVNAAGAILKKPAVDLTDTDWQSIIDLNATATLRACQIFYSALSAHGSGRVINIASLNSFVSLKDVSAYAASKAAVLALTRSLAVEWASADVNVNAIAPGVFCTDLNRDMLENTDRGRELLMRTPMKRFGDVNEVIGAAVLLASDAASFITGQCLVVDGGFLASGVNS